MDWPESYSILFSDYQEQFRPLISKIEVLEEKEPEELYQDVALMFDSFALSINEDDDSIREERLKEALRLKEQAFIRCYRTLIWIIDKRATKSIGKVFYKNSDLLPEGFHKELKDAKAKVRSINTDYNRYIDFMDDIEKQHPLAREKKQQLNELTHRLYERYKEAYNDYENIEKYFKQDPQLEIKILREKWNRRINFSVQWIIPIGILLVGSIIGIFLKWY